MMVAVGVAGLLLPCVTFGNVFGWYFQLFGVVLALPPSRTPGGIELIEIKAK